MTRAATRQLLALGAVAAAAAALYLPFLGNPLVFDDRVFFDGTRFAYYATHPLGLDLRLPAYFSLTATEVLWGGIVAHRVVSLLLHVACALALYGFLCDLQRAALAGADDRGVLLRSTLGAAAFALHPAAVYGAAYLVQRSIVMATLFALLCAILFLRGLRRGRYDDALWAAVLYCLAVLSKEHAVLLPAALLPLIAVARPARRFALRYAALFLVACAPAALFVTLHRLDILGGAYEQAAGAVAAQIAANSGEEIAGRSLALSAVTQAGLFFRYLAAWLWPDPGAMSIDVRVDFAAGWSAAWIAAKLAGFAAGGALGALLLRRGGAAALAGFGLLYAWILFLVEFSAARFQEPFVLYRSYLWGPGYACIAVAALSLLPRRWAAGAGLAALAALAYGGHDRLATFADPLRLWEDAAAKLPPGPVPWGSRTLYGLGREYLYAGRPGKALATTERCERLYPRTAQCIYASGAVRLQQHEFARAADDLRRAIALEPASGVMHHRLGLALECLGRVEDAKASYREARSLGYGGAQIELQRLRAPGVPSKPPACG
jgi:tetratricopeptide (TPR) repeat protein